MKIYTVVSTAAKVIGNFSYTFSKIDYIQTKNVYYAYGIAYQIMMKHFPESCGYIDQEYVVTYPELQGITDVDRIVPYRSNIEYEYEVEQRQREKGLI